jgi:hypothetical protein
MDESYFKESFFRSVAGISFGLAILFCGFESVSGWETFHVGWPQWVYFAIVLGTGTLAGAAYGGRYWLPGALGGAVAGVGALFAVSLPLRVLPIVNRSLFFMVAALGCVPGVGLYMLMRRLQERIHAQIDRKSRQPTGIPEEAWPEALRRNDDKRV